MGKGGPLSQNSLLKKAAFYFILNESRPILKDGLTSVFLKHQFSPLNFSERLK